MQLLKMNEENKKSLDALNETNTTNLNAVRGDIETMVKKVLPENSVALKDIQKKKKKKGTAKAKIKAAMLMAGNLGALKEMEQGMDDIDADVKEASDDSGNKALAQRAKPRLASLLAAGPPIEKKAQEESEDSEAKIKAEEATKTKDVERRGEVPGIEAVEESTSKEVSEFDVIADKTPATALAPALAPDAEGTPLTTNERDIL